MVAARTFETSLRSAFFWFAVIGPPTGYWTVVQVVAWHSSEAGASPTGLMMLILLANLLPLAALAWTLCSVAAYTVAPGKVIEHRVVRDREFPFGANLEVAELEGGVIAVRCSARTLRMRVTEPTVCLAMLREAEAENAHAPARAQT